MILRGLRFSSLSSFLQKNGRYQLDYGSSLPNQQSFKVSDTVRYKLMLLLDVQLLCGSDWRDFAKSLKASNEDIRFLENRKYYHESPTQHIINVFEMMKMPLISLRDIFIDLERDDIAQILTLEIGSDCQTPVVVSRTLLDCPPAANIRETVMCNSMTPLFT